MKRLQWILGASFVGLAMVVAAPAARADHDVDFGVNVPIRGDMGLFFSISSRYFDRDPQIVSHWARRYPNPDDLAVFLYICSKFCIYFLYKFFSCFRSPHQYIVFIFSCTV